MGSFGHACYTEVPKKPRKMKLFVVIAFFMLLGVACSEDSTAKASNQELEELSADVPAEEKDDFFTISWGHRRRRHHHRRRHHNPCTGYINGYKQCNRNYNNINRACKHSMAHYNKQIHHVNAQIASAKKAIKHQKHRFHHYNRKCRHIPTCWLGRGDQQEE